MTPWWTPAFDPRAWIPALRWGLVLLSVAWAALTLRSRPRVAALVGGLLVLAVPLAYFVQGLGRPYGLLVDEASTRRVAAVAIASAGGGDGAVLAADPAGATGWGRLARAGVPERVLIAAPTIAPLIVAPLLLLLLLLDRPPRRAAVAAILWVCAGTGASDVLAGLGFLPGPWLHPGAAGALAIVVAAGVLCARLPQGIAIVAGLAGAALLAGPEWGDRSTGRADALLSLVVHPLPWLLLAGLALRARAVPRSALVLLIAGGAGLLARVAGVGLHPWGAASAWRLGLLIAASPVVEQVADALAAGVAPRLRVHAPKDRLARALLVIVLCPGSLLVWWNPLRVDPVADQSVEPVVLAEGVQGLVQFLRRDTPPGAVVVASPADAPVVAALGGRRVLRAPGLVAAPDDERRAEAERSLLTGGDRAEADGYGVTHVLIVRGQVADHGVEQPETLLGNPRFAPAWSDGRNITLFAVVPGR